MDRLFGALILSLSLLTASLVSIIISEEGIVFSIICIGLAALIGILLLTNRAESSKTPVSNEEIEKELEEFTKG